MEVEAVVADEDDDLDDDEDDEEEEAAVVEAAPVMGYELDDGQVSVVKENDGDDDEEGEEAEVVVATVLPEEPTPQPVPAKKATPPKKKKPAAPKKKTPEKKDTKPKPKKKKKPGTSSAKSSSQATVTEVWPVDSKRVDLAKEARALLHDTVQHLPVVLAETQVRSLGQLKLKGPSVQTPFCTTTSLYPVGFSCDRFEFSPVHGRLLQLRCTILDAARVRQLQKERHAKALWPHAEGPIFRVLWGLGVDEDKWADDAQFPFQAPPPLGGPTKLHKVAPVVGQPVRVRFERQEYYTGVITDVSTAGKGWKISIRYDDGTVEKDTPFPDADVKLLTPGESACGYLSNQVLQLLNAYLIEIFQEWKMKLMSMVTLN